MDLNSRADLQGLKVISFESRRAVEIAELIRRYGGDPFVAPSMREVPLEENRTALELIPDLEAGNLDLLILMTGVGIRTLNQVLLSQFSQERIIAAMQRVKLVVRGPKPAAALKELGLVPAISVPEPNTWREILATLESGIDLRGQRIAIQEYGVPNPELTAGLQIRGATVSAFQIYRWDLPQDLEPLRQAIEKITQGYAELCFLPTALRLIICLEWRRKATIPIHYAKAWSGPSWAPLGQSARKCSTGSALILISSRLIRRWGRS